MKKLNIVRAEAQADQLIDEVFDNAWQFVMDSLNTVLTLDKVNQKPLQRTGKVMQKALNELFFAINEYNGLRKM